MLAALNNMPEGDVVVLHGCCHNPTGVDLDRTQWRAVAAVVAERALLPVVDFAYQGFARGWTRTPPGWLNWRITVQTCWSPAPTPRISASTTSASAR
jgi:histidinol-phosphate/aromatic aminotransferase/cobyric acid decarboxylase-like protein